MEIVQFEIPGRGRRIGFVEGDVVYDITAHRPELVYLYYTIQAAIRENRPVSEFVHSLIPSQSAAKLDYRALLEGMPGGSEPFLHPPLDHPDPHRVLVSGTGLTHTGSVQSRDEMHRGHGAPLALGASSSSSMPMTDSARMFQMGIEGGKPRPGLRGTAPEWFYKGDGQILRGNRDQLEIPPFALDGGEEPEVVGCYLIDATGNPRRVGFALGNEWSDHETERINYLYLAPSKLRTCSIGPTLNTHETFQDVAMRCTVRRGERVLYDSGTMYTGEKWMCHSLQNLEDHHFKYPQHRRAGDVHLHFFGTSKLSHGTRNWRYEPGDEIRIEAPEFSAPLVNPVAAEVRDNAHPFKVTSA